MPDDTQGDGPNVPEDFERASKESEKGEKDDKLEKLKLELKPPVPSPMGMEPAPPLVSPQLRGEERKETLRQVLLKRDFNNAARDPVER